MRLTLIDSVDFSIIQFPVTYNIPKSLHELKTFKSVTYTDDECSIIAPTDLIDTTNALAVDPGWFIIQITGVLDFSLVGILTQLANPLAENNISIFALSTYNTDYLLIKNKDKEQAIKVLSTCGHTFS
ncbi:ACT domain-containing protein [Enterococcus sp. AZ192]|uniref:ACT domain-containing protein n=1 Tax=unclassified Enterococcus TaxID=2608891 RepID=UPI003D28EADA